MPDRTEEKGKSLKNYKMMTNAFLYILKTGALWRDLTFYYGPWKLAYIRFERWSRARLWN